MSHKLRNLSVGVVVIAAMFILGWMIFKFGAAPAQFFKPPQVNISFAADRADGLGDGSNILYKGVEVGRILTVKRDPTADTIIITAQVNKAEALPANLAADIVFSSPLGGVSALNLKLTSPKPEGLLADGAVLQARYLGSTFLPPEFTELARNANDAVKSFNDSKLIDTIKQTIELTKTRIDQTGKLIEGASTLVNDPKLREDLTASLASIRATADNARQITDRVNKLTDRFDAIAAKTESTVDAAKTTLDTTTKRIDEISASAGIQLVKVSKLLDNVTDITGKINTGAGTAGQLVNDPKLYQALVAATKELDAGLSDFRRLVQQWEQEGVTLKLGK